MQILDMGAKVYVTATVVGVTIGADKRVSYRVNVPGLGNFNCPSDNMSEVGEKKEGAIEAYWQKIKFDNGRESLVCSNCHEDSGTIRPTKYCPNCGKHMAGPKKLKED